MKRQHKAGNRKRGNEPPDLKLLAKVSAKRRAAVEHSSFDAAEAGQIVARKLFGDDWIGALSARDDKLIHDYVEIEPLHPEQPPAYSLRYPVDRLRIGSAKPVPAALRTRLDRAIGRYLRMNAQRITVDKWLKKHGPPAVFGSYDRNALLKALADIDAPVIMPTAGQRSVVEAQVERAIRAALKDGELTEAEFTKMKLKDVSAQFGGGKDTARKVKNRILQHSQK